MHKGLGFIFPGQGSQKEGMLAELAAKHELVGQTFREASEVLGYDLWALCQNDPDNRLGLTHITQPAILTASVAIWRLWLAKGGPRPELMAGHSLGEYSALVCSGSLDFGAAVGLVQKRGEFMQSAVPVGQGGMAAIVGLDDSSVIAACEEAAQEEVVNAVNFNSPGQVVIAGNTDAVSRAMEICKAKGAKRALPLPVSAPFHSALMQPAAERFAEVLNDITLHEAEIPVLQNYDLSLSTDNGDSVKDKLIKQIYSPVPWVQTIRHFSQHGIKSIYELGPGKVLCGLNKRIDPEMSADAINDEPGLEGALKACQQ